MGAAWRRGRYGTYSPRTQHLVHPQLAARQLSSSGGRLAVVLQPSVKPMDKTDGMLGGAIFNNPLTIHYTLFIISLLYR